MSIMQEKEIEKKAEQTIEWYDDIGDFAMEKINGGCTTICARCDGSGMHDGAPCDCCGGTGWRR